jgi:hypothetical protein
VEGSARFIQCEMSARAALELTLLFRVTCLGLHLPVSFQTDGPKGLQTLHSYQNIYPPEAGSRLGRRSHEKVERTEP